MGARWDRYLAWRARRQQQAEDSGYWPFLNKRAYLVTKWGLLAPFIIGLVVFTVMFLSKVL